MAAAWAYSNARARNPSGGAGSTIRSSTRPCSASALTYRDSGRCTKRMNTPCSTCSTESCSTRYGPIRQYCSGGSIVWSSIQPDPGRLQQRMVEEEREPAAGPQDPGHLGDRAVDVVDVLEHQTRDHRVERSGGERQVRRTGSGEHRSPATLGGDPDLVPRRVDADHRRAPCGEQPADLAVAAADVEHPVEPVEFARRRAGGSARCTPGRPPR